LRSKVATSLRSSPASAAPQPAPSASFSWPCKASPPEATPPSPAAITPVSIPWAPTIALAFLLIAAESAIAAEVKAPAKVSGETGDFVLIQATTTPANSPVKWVALSKGLKVLPAAMLKDPTACVVTSFTPGTYKLLAYTGDSTGPSEPVTVTVVLTGAVPTDGLLADLQDAYTADADAVKATSLPLLAALYRQAEAAVDDPATTTTAELLATLKTASASLLPATALAAERKVISAYLQTALGTTSSTLDAATRAKVKAAFQAVATAIAGVK
jgi:hypothetical protein